jgi:hypothetical protein
MIEFEVHPTFVRNYQKFLQVVTATTGPMNENADEVELGQSIKVTDINKL